MLILLAARVVLATAKRVRNRRSTRAFCVDDLGNAVVSYGELCASVVQHLLHRGDLSCAVRLQPLEYGAQEDVEGFGVVRDDVRGLTLGLHGLLAHEAGVNVKSSWR